MNVGAIHELPAFSTPAVFPLPAAAKNWGLATPPSRLLEPAFRHTKNPPATPKAFLIATETQLVQSA